jgi:site-specific DNA-methyltransferase (adenine-specific)
MSKTKLLLGDNIQSLQKLPDNSVDSIVSDPPYGLSFMGKKWDYDVPSVEFWREVYRVLKPGGHVLSFGGTRTYHRMVVNIEDAGFEIRDQIMWLYGSGFPKSHNIGKAVDKLQGNDREVVGVKKNFLNIKASGKSMYDEAWHGNQRIDLNDTKGQSPYEGWGTALKPANEPICVARKPLSENTIAENVLKWGTGGINIDGCRVGSEIMKEQVRDNDGGMFMNKNKVLLPEHEGRFPANIILDEIAGEMLDEQSGVSKSSPTPSHKRKGNVVADERTAKAAGIFGDGNMLYGSNHSDKGGASRFFYQAKVSKAERNMGLDEFDEVKIKTNISGLDDKPREDGSIRETPSKKNTHPTVKPVALMAYLCRLVTPVNGIVLDPFMGSGSTGIAARLEGFKFCGMEMDKDYFKIAEARIENFEEYRKFIK